MSTHEIEGAGHRPPTLARRVGEVLAFREPFRLAFELRNLTAIASTDPKNVVALPGLGANDLSTLPMRRFLARLGHHPRGWGLGVHRSDLEQTLAAFLPRAEAMVAELGGPLALVGWSLGGIVARETARDRPDLVSSVITYGSPLKGPRHTSAAGVYPDSDIQRIEALIRERERSAIRRPVTAIYSKADGVVDCTTCIDRTTPGAQNIEVRSTHLGMGLDPDVWRIVAQKLDAASAWSTRFSRMQEASLT